MTEQHPDQDGGVPDPPDPAGRFSEAAGRLSEEVGTLVRAELERARMELTETARETGRGSLALTAGGVCALLALLSAHEAVLRAAERHWPPPQRAATVVGLGYASGAAAFASFGCWRLRKARAASREALAHMVPDRTAD
ncbi:phage holin family protein [Streptomyces sp. NRRL S-1448]|uniref:phage holin family protein n=1 Tax=Streptomyces sp. NRRL S-1448 TaxID=1463883 RepID=UPI00068D1560|nr:phage holin family protein [Streptomyces sp. NRRL S-1448]